MIEPPDLRTFQRMRLFCSFQHQRKIMTLNLCLNLILFEGYSRKITGKNHLKYEKDQKKIGQML